MNDFIDRVPWPQTPEDMYGLLMLEDQVKREWGGFTQHGLNGYLITKLNERQLILDRALYGFSAIDMTTGERVDPRKVTPAWD
jgi:hypothetical protein